MLAVYLEYQGDSVELPTGETTIGRDIGCALRFNDQSVSRRHVKFIRRADEVFVEDLGSSNGTRINGELIGAPTPISDGDILLIGTREITVRIPTEPYREPATRDLGQISDANDRGSPRRTSTMPVTVPPALRVGRQKCPRCGNPVSEDDDMCAKCNYEWGTFRPTTPTHHVANPLNRRRHERQALELHLVYTSPELEIEVKTHDLSESGVFVTSKILDPVGTMCDLTLLIDGGPPLRLRGIVRRVVAQQGEEPEGLGIEFLELAPPDLRWLRSVIDRANVTQPIERLE